MCHPPSISPPPGSTRQVYQFTPERREIREVAKVLASLILNPAMAPARRAAAASAGSPRGLLKLHLKPG